MNLPVNLNFLYQHQIIIIAYKIILKCDFKKKNNKANYMITITSFVFKGHAKHTKTILTEF